MDRFLVLLISFFSIAFADAQLHPAAVYWNNVFPDTPMPSPIQHLLSVPRKKPAIVVDAKANAFHYGHSATVAEVQDANSFHYGHPATVAKVQDANSFHYGHADTKAEVQDANSIHYGHPATEAEVQDANSFHYGHANTKAEVQDANSFHYGHPATEAEVQDAKSFHYGHVDTEAEVQDANSFHYGHADTEAEVQDANVFRYGHAGIVAQVRGDNPTTSLFFLEKDLRPGAKMTLHFARTAASAAPFVPRQVANSIPFSSSEILDRFSIRPYTAEAEAIHNTLSVCEEQGIVGENKHCATSLESMVDFSMSTLGTRDIEATSTTVSKEGTPKRQAYTVAASGMRRLPGSKVVVCHGMTYAYAVFYCHTTPMTRAYRVAVAGRDGTKAEAVAVCHGDTSKWDPKHVAFLVLDVEPGTVPVCHFLLQGHLVWSPKK